MSRILLRVQLPCLIRFNKNKKPAKHPTQQMQQNQRDGRRGRRMRCDNKVRDGRRIRRMRCNNKVRDGRRGRRMQMQGGWCRQNRSNLMVVRILSSHPTQQMRPYASPSPSLQTLRYCCRAHISSRNLAAAWKSSSAEAFFMLVFAVSTAFSTCERDIERMTGS